MRRPGQCHPPCRCHWTTLAWPFSCLLREGMNKYFLTSLAGGALRLTACFFEGWEVCGVDPAKAEGSRWKDSGGGAGDRRHAALPAPVLPGFDTSLRSPIPALGISLRFGIDAVKNYQMSRKGLLEINTSRQPGRPRERLPSASLIRLSGQGPLSVHRKRGAHLCRCADNNEAAKPELIPATAGARGRAVGQPCRGAAVPGSTEG